MMTAAVLAMAATPLLAGGGNQTPTGDHYNLNIIGVDQAKKPPFTSGDRHTIFMPLVTSSLDGPDTDTVPAHEIWLFPTPLANPTDFNVCDGNGFDVAHNCTTGSTFCVPGTGTYPACTLALGASFALPCNTGITVVGTLIPCDTTTTASASYSVWARVVGTPGGSATITTCAFDSTNTLVCSINEKVLVREKPNWFSNVTDVLTSIVCSGASSCAGHTLELFAPGFTGFFWDYDNSGDKLLQLRFYVN
ncbi:MAG TPA: hypothetical protein VGR73_18660 [Bryobacteraceae bacterium]|nr:hypothetical protein [Bryobacteraceae bacterium]